MEKHIHMLYNIINALFDYRSFNTIMIMQYYCIEWEVSNRTNFTVRNAHSFNYRFNCRLRKSCYKLNVRQFTATVRPCKPFTFTWNEVTSCVFLSAMSHYRSCWHVHLCISVSHYAFSLFDCVEAWYMPFVTGATCTVY